MANTVPKNSVWSAMSYTPPKGRCNHKTSLMSPACPCLRFMLHPVKAATSFECDGCGHHASYHSLENPAEDAVLKKWSEQEADTKQQQAIAIATKKRKRIAATAVNEAELVELASEDSDVPDLAVSQKKPSNVKAKAKPKVKAVKALPKLSKRSELYRELMEARDALVDDFVTDEVMDQIADNRRKENGTGARH